MKANVKNTESTKVNANVNAAHNTESTQDTQNINVPVIPEISIAVEQTIKSIRQDLKNFREAANVAKKEINKRMQELEFIVTQINEAAKVPGSETDKFFKLCKIDIRPAQKKNEREDKVYFDASYITDCWPLKNADGELTEIRRKRDKDTGKFETYTAKVEIFTVAKVINALRDNSTAVQRKALEERRKAHQAKRNAKKSK